MNVGLTYNEHGTLYRFIDAVINRQENGGAAPCICALSQMKNKRAASGGFNEQQKKDFLTLVIGALVICLLLVGAMFLVGEDDAAQGERSVRILRVMTVNDSTCLPVGGEYLDWVELVNVSAMPVDLNGWRLSSGLDIREGCVFPARTLQPGESMIVYAGNRPAAAPADALFASFALSSDGASLTLCDAKNVVRDSLEVPVLGSGEVYAYDAAADEYSRRSPYDDLGMGMDLSEEIYPAHAGGLVISEIMAVNGSSVKDSSGQNSDWIEIYNGTGSAVNLAGCSLSEDSANRRRFVFPDVTLGAGEYRLVFASGGERTSGELHAAFKLSSEGEHVVLYDPMGQALSYMEYEKLDTDESAVRRADGGVETTFLVSPGYPNTEEGARNAIDPMYLTPVQNAMGLYINEVAASVDATSDWVEIINESTQNIDLSGFGLSDNPNRPRKWQFPNGTVVPAGGGLVVSLVGASGSIDSAPSPYVANFALDAAGGESIVLSDAQGQVIDQIMVNCPRRNISYGRMAGETSYVYFTSPTPGANNGGSYYRRCAEEVQFSHTGGIQAGPVQLTLSAEPGMAIYYTMDGSEPSAASAVYTGPMTITTNTVIKAIAWSSDSIPSYSKANTYLFGVNHTTPIVCVSGRPDELTGPNGTLITGNIGSGYDVHAEIYDENGNQLVSQGCMLKVNGRSSRTMYDQRAFRLVAKNEYGDNRFRAELFSNRDYDEYKAVVVRAAGQDNRIAYMRDVVFTSRAQNTSVMYQESEVVVAYVNGQFWGAYHLRERISPESICQFEGWENPDAIDLLEGAGLARVQGSSDTFKQMMQAVKSYGVASDENLAALRTMMDVENYLEYVMLQMYCNNHDLNNIRMYRNAEEDGLWRWIIFDTDLGFRNERDSVKEWCQGRGEVGSITQQDNTLFVALMQNPTTRDWFLTRFGQLLATDLSSEAVLAKIEQVYNDLVPEMPLHCQRWDWSMSSWQNGGQDLVAYAQKQTKRIITSLIEQFQLTEAQAQQYLGQAMLKEGM